MPQTDETAGLLETPATPQTIAQLQETSKAELFRSARLKAMIGMMMDGSMPYGRILRTREVQKFSALHVNVVLDRAAGMKSAELVEKYDLSAHTVGMILGHPYTEILMGELVSGQAEKLIDPLARMQGVAHEMINTKLEIVRDPETPKRLRNDVASDMLDRAGFAPKRHLESEVKHTIHIPAPAAARLVDMLDQSMRVEPASYEAYLMRPDGLLEGEIPSASEDLAPSAGHTEESAGASPGAPSATSRVA